MKNLKNLKKEGHKKYMEYPYQIKRDSFRFSNYDKAMRHILGQYNGGVVDFTRMNSNELKKFIYDLNKYMVNKNSAIRVKARLDSVYAKLYNKGVENGWSD